MQKDCQRCGKSFFKQPSDSIKYWSIKIYCSKHCANSRPSHNKGKILINRWREKVTYGALHKQVYKKYGRPKKCISCGSTKNVEWANKSNKYINVDDFIALCGSCHHKYDIKMNGTIPWNKDKKGLQVAWNKGIPQSPEAKEKNRLSHLGQVAWNKRIERKMIICKCGCGQSLPNIGKNGHEVEYIYRHYYQRNKSML